MAHQAMVETDRLSKHYQQLRALDQLTLSIQPGEVFGLLGPNGSGKTTFLRLLMGFIKPTSGTARINGLDCYRDSVAAHANLAYLPGDVRLHRLMRGRDIIKFYSRIHPLGNEARSFELADLLELDLNRRVAFGSTGMRQKLALIGVLATKAPLIILDEPTANLDPTIRAKVLELVRQAKANGQTVLFSSHVLAETEAACDRVAILRRGELVHQQSISSLLDQHRISGRLTGTYVDPPKELNLQVERNDDRILIETPGDIQPVLRWLVNLPIEQLRVEPVRLQAVYEKFHPRD